MSEGTIIPNGHERHVEDLKENVVVPPEIEATITRLSAQNKVRGVMVLSRGVAGGPGGVIQSSGTIFEGEGGRNYARVVESLVATVGSAVGEVDEGDELQFMRIRTKRHELMIRPDVRYLLVVLHDPGQ